MSADAFQTLQTPKVSQSTVIYEFQSLNTFAPLFAGGISSTIAQCITCPLDVVQTRLQSTQLNFNARSCTIPPAHIPTYIFTYFHTLMKYMKQMTQAEGYRSLFKGLCPGLFGIVPAKSIYFFCYANSKKRLTKTSRYGNTVVHSTSACFAGLVTATVTNPIWYIKTQLQLNKTSESMRDIINKGYRFHGAKCFFRGLSASYVGVSETVIYFLLYEELKEQLSNKSSTCRESFQPTNFILAALTSKLIATSLTYPHEVVRTRLRQDERDTTGRLKYRNFFQALATVAKEEGRGGLYGGFGTGMVRQLPSTGLLFVTYEAILYLVDRD